MNEVANQLLRLKKTKIPNLVYRGTLDPRKLVDKDGFLKKW
jgi:hypothetical protein